MTTKCVPLPHPPHSHSLTNTPHLGHLGRPLQCLIKNPNMRPSAMTLLDFPWLAMHGAVDLDSSVDIVRDWLDSMGMVDEAHSRIAILTGGK